MSYIGTPPTQQAFTPAVDFFNGNGSTTAFTLSRPVASVAQVQAVISNVPQKPGDAFTVSGNTITFTSAPPSGTQNIYVYYTSPITQVIAPGQGTVTTTALQDGSVTPAKLSTGAPTWNSSGNIAGANATIGTTNLTLRAAANTYVGGALALQDAAGTSKGYVTQIGATTYFGDNSSNDCATVNQYGVGLGGNAATSGLGIRFPATQSASSDANTLDDYEEGTWTPTINSGTFTATRARYTKIGRVVTVSAYCDTFSDRSSATSVSIGGLPFATGDAENIGSVFLRYSNNAVTAVYIGSGGNTSLSFYGTTTGNYSPLQFSQLNNASAQIYFEATYTASA